MDTSEADDIWLVLNEFIFEAIYLFYIQNV
jgi:hypothetical protein